jgi:MoaA/NifB/PqqE/SkfB family radical SAM enzyme
MLRTTTVSETFSQSIQALMGDALRLCLKDPAMAGFLFRAGGHQRQAAARRLALEQEGLHVPALAIVSITKRCNLNCKGCYARAQHRDAAPEMDATKLGQVIAEASELGVSFALIAGGEPLTRPEILDITARHPEMIFPLFTNGLLVDEAMIARFKAQRQVVPVLSLEGHQIETDARRGEGVYGHVLDTMAALRKAGVFFGCSITLTRYNYDVIAQGDYIREMIALGCRLFFLVEYVPIQPGTEDLVLTEEQRASQFALLERWHDELPGLFVALPGDEEQYGGCLAAGRGFIHISPEGRLEPCPFAPFSDVNLHNATLREALRSNLLSQIRESDAHLSETRGGCALWANREWVQSLL